MAGQSPIVLVHGAFQSAATWDLVAPRLQRERPAGNRRHTDRSRAGCRTALRNRHARDTYPRCRVDLLERHDLHDVVLVGHSYGGMIVTGVAEHARDRIGHLVYVDALVPEHGQAALEIMTVAIADTFRQLAAEGGGWRMRATGKLVDKWGLEEGSPARSFVEARLCDFTLRCFDQPLEAPTDAAATLPRTYIASVKDEYPARVVFEPFAARARREGWGYHELPTGHDCQAEMPGALSDLLLQISVDPAVGRPG